jgi:hypothetical protein
MNRRKRAIEFGLFGLVFILLSPACQTRVPTRNRADETNLPKIFLWAWERPEDLEFLDPKRFGVAFLAQTLVLKGDRVDYIPRLQPLKVTPDTKLIAVTRIESSKTTGQRADMSRDQITKLVDLVLKTRELKNISAIQIDFDAAVSEREFYRSFLEDLRKQLPDNVPLSMTALASFCLGDRWLSDLPVDEAVPMIFRMGLDDKAIKSFLTGGGDFREPLCRKSYGITLDEPIEMRFEAARRIFVFNARPWTQKDLELLLERFPG